MGAALGPVKNLLGRFLDYGTDRSEQAFSVSTEFHHKRNWFTLRFKDAAVENRFRAVWFNHTMRPYRIAMLFCFFLVLFDYAAGFFRYPSPWELYWNHIFNLAWGLVCTAIMISVTFLPFARYIHSWFNACSFVVLYMGIAWAYNALCSRDPLNTALHVCFCTALATFSAFLKIPFLEHFVSTVAIFLMTTVPLFVMSFYWNKFDRIDMDRELPELLIVAMVEAALVLFVNIQAYTTERFWREFWCANVQLSIECEDLRIERETDKILSEPALAWSDDDSEDDSAYKPFTDLYVDRDLLTFDLGETGACPIMQPVTDSVFIRNDTEAPLYYCFFVPIAASHEIDIRPGKGTMEPGEGRNVVIKCTLLYTTTLDKRIKLIVKNPDDGNDVKPVVRYLNFSLKGKSSFRLDPDEITLEPTAFSRGASGAVYRGMCRGRTVAVKVLKNQNMLTDESLADFEKEVAVLSKLRHDCIVQFVGASHVPGKLCICTELLENHGNLETFIYATPNLHIVLKLRIAVNIASAMAHIHANNILYRDLKPANILVVSTSTTAMVNAKLIDFGTSDDVRDADVPGSHTSGIGTPLYMAPEMLNPRGEYNAKVDVYSFALTLWELFTQQQPWSDIKIWDISNTVLSGARPDVNSPGISGDMAAIIQRCWAQDYSKRPSFDVICDELSEVLVTETRSYKKQRKAGAVESASRVAKATDASARATTSTGRSGSSGRCASPQLSVRLDALENADDGVDCASASESLSRARMLRSQSGASRTVSPSPSGQTADR